ncbi:hypothetical protein [Nocardia otitidiscaviarum]|uniref:hypothetical protein n=1 Tax=Nocardia otitidiscaviarum TaxID=1823 RepID=UPI001893857C|nr:hypothetical protein [Nocardia otitidiscaviarum]MBF6177957.1 hypothetical protein [Nocardia otitidiscaviarum]
MKRFAATAVLLVATAAALTPTTAAQQPGPASQPNPWVQDQIDWANCLQSGHTAAECREILDGPATRPTPR